MYSFNIGDLIKTNSKITVSEVQKNYVNSYELIHNEQVLVVTKQNEFGCLELFYNNKLFIFDPKFSRTFGGFGEIFTVLKRK